MRKCLIWCCKHSARPSEEPHSNCGKQSLDGFEQGNEANPSIIQAVCAKKFSLFITSTAFLKIFHRVHRWPASNIPNILALFCHWKANGFLSLEHSFPDILLSNWSECPLTASSISEGIAIIIFPLTKSYHRGILTVLKANEIMFYC